MIGKKLHQYDVALCRYALDNVRGYTDRPAFAAFVEDQLDPPVLAYLRALGGDEDPPPLLLTDRDFYDLADTFDGGPIEFDRVWVADEALHRRAIDCVPEIKAALAQECAEEWVRASATSANQLDSDRARLGSGIRLVHDWVREARRLLKAMETTALLPRPEGAFPTPACPEPSRPGEPRAATVTRDGQASDEGLMAAITQTQALQLEVRDLLLSQRTVRDFYTTAEVARLLGKAEFTVREWCRNGRVRGQKQGSGRGKHQAWVISHEELQRLQREGLLPTTRSC